MAGLQIPTPVNSSHCVPDESQLEVKHKLMSCGRFTIKDGDGALLFDVKCKSFWSWRKRRVMRDTSGQPVLLLKSLCPSLHSKWAAFKGDGDETDDKLLFTIEKSAFFQVMPAYNVFLPTSSDPSKPAFAIKSNFLHTVYTVLYNGTPIAKVKKRCFSTKHDLTIEPGVDRAFISALVIFAYSQCCAVTGY